MSTPRASSVETLQAEAIAAVRMRADRLSEPGRPRSHVVLALRTEGWPEAAIQTVMEERDGA